MGIADRYDRAEIGGSQCTDSDRAGDSGNRNAIAAFEYDRVCGLGGTDAIAGITIELSIIGRDRGCFAQHNNPAGIAVIILWQDDDSASLGSTRGKI